MKILAVLVNFGTEQLDYLEQVVSELKLFKKYEVTVIVNSNILLDIKGIDKVNVIELGNYQLLPLTCRKVIWENRNDYDVFIYGENDHLFKEHHVDKHLEYEKILPKDRITGLMQYEINDKKELYYPAYHARYDWDMDSVEIYGGLKFAHFTNLHQATFILSKNQLLKIGILNDFTNFMGQSYYSWKCKVNTDIYQFGGMKKLICISEFDDNLIHHLPNIYISGDRGRLKLGSWDKRMRDKLNILL